MFFSFVADLQAKSNTLSAWGVRREGGCTRCPWRPLATLSLSAMGGAGTVDMARVPSPL